MASTVRIHWSREFDNKQMWNEVLFWAIEYFGLPGDRFYTEANVNYMDFHFKSNKDALLMAIRWSAEIIPEEQLTLELVGSRLH
jgi:hypothetical protein